MAGVLRGRIRLDHTGCSYLGGGGGGCRVRVWRLLRQSGRPCNAWADTPIALLSDLREPLRFVNAGLFLSFF